MNVSPTQTFDGTIASAPRPWMRPLHALRARCLHHRLDAALAAGRSPWSDPALFARAVVLTSPRERRRIAFAVVALVRLAEFRRPASPLLKVRHAAVLSERQALLRLAARLDADEPVDVQTVAQLARLVWDRRSPAFENGRPPAELEAVVRRGLETTGVER